MELRSLTLCSGGPREELRLTRVRSAMLLLSAWTAYSTAEPLTSPTTTQSRSHFAVAVPSCLPGQAPCARRDSSGITRATVVAIAGLLGGNTLVLFGSMLRGNGLEPGHYPMRKSKRTFRRVEELPRNWYPVPGGMPTEWFLWNEHLRGVPLPVGGPILGEAHCQAVWGLSTRLQPFGHETTAIATNGQSDIHPFEHSTLDGTADPRLRSSGGRSGEISDRSHPVDCKDAGRRVSSSSRFRSRVPNSIVCEPGTMTVSSARSRRPGGSEVDFRRSTPVVVLTSYPCARLVCAFSRGIHSVAGQRDTHRLRRQRVEDCDPSCSDRR